MAVDKELEIVSNDLKTNEKRANCDTQKTQINDRNTALKEENTKVTTDVENKDNKTGKKNTKKSKNVVLQYNYDNDSLYEEVDNDNRKIIHIKNVLFLLMIIGIFLVIYLLIPKIKLYGEENIIISYDSLYVEPGYKVRLFFKDVSDRVVVSNNILEHKIGNYEVNYIYKFLFFDIKRTREVKIVDEIVPIISLENEDIKLCPNEDVSKIKYSAVDEYDGDITGSVKINEDDNKVIFSVTDSSGNYLEKIVDVSRIDDEKPEIVLSGQTVMYINVGTRYVEPGYRAMDNCDGDIGNKVVVSGTVGISVGTYKIIYTVIDSSNNKTEVTRTVIVRNSNLYNNGSINNGSIYLTFDDGPNEGTTGYILDVLKEEGVKATFFVTCNGSDYLIKRMYDEGHTVALHTATHNYSYIYSSVNNYFADLQRVSDRVKRITSIDSKIIRFPGGSSNTVSRQYQKGIMTNLTYQVLDKGYRYYDWNVDSGDAGGAGSSSQVYYNVINGLSYNRSNVVLMHDTKYTTRGAIRDIIRYGKSNGYKFEKITMDTYMVRHGVNN